MTIRYKEFIPLEKNVSTFLKYKMDKKTNCESFFSTDNVKYAHNYSSLTYQNEKNN